MGTEVASTLVLRPARDADSPHLLRWRNDPLMRRAARETAWVERRQHERGLSEVLPDPDRDLLVGEIDGKPAGQVRFDLISNRVYEVGITVAPECRGAGVGRLLLGSGLEWLWANRDAERVDAVVRAWNEPSIATFRALRFQPAACREEGFVLLALSRPAGV